LYTYFVSVRFRSKTSIFIFGFTKFDIRNACHRIQSTRTINIFTGRGVRFNRQVIYRKPGKISSYR
jgi:ribosomal protein L6P/L9E